MVDFQSCVHLRYCYNTYRGTERDGKTYLHEDIVTAALHVLV